MSLKRIQKESKKEDQRGSKRSKRGSKKAQPSNHFLKQRLRAFFGNQQFLWLVSFSLSLLEYSHAGYLLYLERLYESLCTFFTFLASSNNPFSSINFFKGNRAILSNVTPYKLLKTAAFSYIGFYINFSKLCRFAWKSPTISFYSFKTSFLHNFGPFRQLQAFQKSKDQNINEPNSMQSRIWG